MTALFQNWKALALVLVFLLLLVIIFRDPITHTIERSKEVEVGPSGIKLVSTPIGEITGGEPLQESTNQTTNKQTTGQPCSAPRTYCSDKYGFLISWPNDIWKAQKDLPASRLKDYALPEGMDVPIYINKTVGSNNVLAVSVGTAPMVAGIPSDINKWMEEYKQALPLGTKLDSTVDAQTNSAVAVVVGTDGLTAVKKFIIANNRL